MITRGSSTVLRRSLIVVLPPARARCVSTFLQVAAPHYVPPINRRFFSYNSRQQNASIIEERSQTTSRSTTDGAQNEVLSLEAPLISLDRRNGQIGVTWSSGIESKYHNIWLRDHCRCGECYHPKTKQRLLDTFSIPSNICPQSIDATTEGLLVEWPRQRQETLSESKDSQEKNQDSERNEGDIHNSLYPWSWLYSNSYAPSLTLASAGHRDDNAILWGKGIAQQPPSVAYSEVMSLGDEQGIAKWLNKLSQFGFCFVTDVPPTPEDTKTLIERIAFIRETHYGGFWDFTSDMSHGDTAYTNLALGAHTDTTYFTDPAGLQMFHLLSHTAAEKDGSPASGGESLLVDGFFAAKILREVYPEAYNTLSTVRFSTHSAGDDDTLIRPLKRGGYPILEHDELTGELIRVRYNNDDRSVLRVKEEQILPFYDALKKWHEILIHADSEYWSQLVPGTALIFDNHRVLHGRSAFTGNRRLCGAYIQHDDYRSRLAVLRKRYPEFEGIRRAVRGANVTASSVHHRGVWDDGI